MLPLSAVDVAEQPTLFMSWQFFLARPETRFYTFDDIHMQATVKDGVSLKAFLEFAVPSVPSSEASTFASGTIDATIPLSNPSTARALPYR